MNQTIITGNLTADIETREIQSRNPHDSGDQHLSKFTVASNEGERVVFMPVEAWNMPHLCEHLFKGSKVLISGSLKQETWEADSGDKRSRMILTAYRVEFLDPAPEADAPAKTSRQADKGTRGHSRKHRSSQRQRSVA